MAIWDDSFKYAGKGGFGAELVSPIKNLKNVLSGTLSRISFQAGSFVLLLPFLDLKVFCLLQAFVVINYKFFLKYVSQAGKLLRFP